MSIKPHLLPDEEVIEFCTTDYWTWVCTNKRVIKYKSGSGGAEQMHDISFKEISGISLTNTGRNDWVGGFGILGAIFSIPLLIFEPGLAIVLGGISATLIYYWWNSGKAFFEFRGTGLVQQEKDQWRINKNASEDQQQMQAFVRTVRSQLEV